MTLKAMCECGVTGVDSIEQLHAFGAGIFRKDHEVHAAVPDVQRARSERPGGRSQGSRKNIKQIPTKNKRQKFNYQTGQNYKTGKTYGNDIFIDHCGASRMHLI